MYGRPQRERASSDLAKHPDTDLLDCLTQARVFRPSRLEPVDDVLGAR
jgi:hypothetical protein